MIVMNRERYAPGRRVGENVSLLDCAPTLLEWAGFEQAPPPLDGQSFVPALENENWIRREPVIAESIGVERGKPGLMIKQRALKLILYRDTPAILFDLEEGTPIRTRWKAFPIDVPRHAMVFRKGQSQIRILNPETGPDEPVVKVPVAGGGQDG